MKRDFAAANPKAVDGVVRAIIEGYGFIFNKNNKQAVKEIIARNLRLPNIDAADDFYEEALEELDRKPYPTLEGLQSVLNETPRPEAKTARPEQFVNTELLDELKAAGFFDELRARYGD